MNQAAILFPARLTSLALGIGLITGCQVGPDYKGPASAAPVGYHHAETVSTNAPTGQLATWWTVFNDETLNWLATEAIKSNHDLRLAKAQVLEARALRGVARAGLFPEVNGGADYVRSRSSKISTAGQMAKAGGQPLENDFFNVGPDISWEIDVFGGKKRGVEAAHAELEAAEESRRGVLVTVLAEVGLNYLDLRGAQKQLAVARENLRTQKETLALAQDRHKAGLTSELDATRASAQVADTRSQIPPLETEMQRAIHRLSVLLGKNPAELETRLVSEAALPVAAPRVPLGLPSDLLRQRPDIRRAERETAAATARIGVAKAELFPKFYLTGAAGLQSIEATDFFDAGSRYWSLGPSIRWPIFNAGRLRQNVQVQNARQEQSLIRYEQIVLIAFEEVENALVSFGKEQDRFQALQESETASRRSVVIARDRYQSGMADYLNVLEAERSLLAAQENLVRSERSLGQNMVRLYKALGGGWDFTRKS
ncbi:MAG: NodT protein [Verrucomicrobia bacterium]|jgi:NodT family efflux transporter outer membrane factor (OMF) lipoprotein|nr:NodT protein [Verrucomicrobiota bacterium]